MQDSRADIFTSPSPSLASYNADMILVDTLGVILYIRSGSPSGSALCAPRHWVSPPTSAFALPLSNPSSHIDGRSTHQFNDGSNSDFFPKLLSFHELQS